MLKEPTVLLAALDNGQHVQVGRVREHGDAYALFERMDSQISGFVRFGKLGPLMYRPDGRKTHFIDGHAVKFYRLRQQGHEFGDVPSYPISAVRLTNRPKEDSNTMNTKTRGGIARPQTGPWRSFGWARFEAKRLNAERGRGFRALKAQDGGYAVVFRPAVANNRQRRVREVI